MMNFVTSLLVFSFIIFHHVNLELDILNNFDDQNVVGTAPKESSNTKQMTRQHQQQQQQQQRRRSVQQPMSSSRTTYYSEKPASAFNAKSQAKNAASSGTAKKTVLKKDTSDNANAVRKAPEKNALETELKTQTYEDDLSLVGAKESIHVQEISEASASDLGSSLPVDCLNAEAEDSKDFESGQSKKSIDDVNTEQTTVSASQMERKQDVISEENEITPTSVEIQEQRTAEEEQIQRSDVESNQIVIAEANGAAAADNERSAREVLHKDSFSKTSEMSIASDTSADKDLLMTLNSGNDFHQPDLNIDSAQPVKTTGDAGQLLESNEVMTSGRDSDSFSESKVSGVGNVSKAKMSATEEPLASTSPDEGTSSTASDQHPGLIQPPFQSTDELVNGIPSTAFIPGDKKPDSELKLVAELEESSAMPSFREWKEKETEKNRQLGAEQTLHPVGATSKAKGNKKGINYASVTCGAKIVAANQEAQNPHFMLIENKDQYMINPCKARKIFTVELCEAIQVQKVEIGNLELFSSLPRSFDVHVSDRFPSKEWKALGRFHARDERTVQTFQVDDGFIFAKYVRIEMLSHYGSEHYCPLSVLRVFGTNLDEDDDVDEGESENLDVLDEEAVMDTFTQDNPTNLFASATDTVLSLVKTVLNPSTDVAPKEKDAMVAVTIDNESSVNSSNERNKTLEPCLPEVTSGSSEVDVGAVSRENLEELLYEPEVPGATVKTFDQRSDDELNQSSGEPDNHLEQFKITLIEVPTTSLKDIIRTCDFCDDGKNDSCLLDCQTVCGYYRVMSFVGPQSCLTAWRYIRNAQAGTQIKASVSVPTSQTVEPVGVQSSSASEIKTGEHRDDDAEFSTTKISSEFVEMQIADGTKEMKMETVKAAESPPEAVHSGTDNKGGDVAAPAKALDETRSVYDDSQQVIVEQMADSSVEGISSLASGDSNDRGQSCPECLPHEEIPNQSENVEQGHDQAEKGAAHAAPGQVNSANTVQGTIPGQEQSNANIQYKASDQKATEHTLAKSSSDKDESSSNHGSNMKEIYAEASSKVDYGKDYELDSISLDEITFQKLSPRGKESAFIKLKNRIKLLEVNLNLTNRYLEELSQRYKRQMEDMHSSLNKTITKLSNMAKLAEERDVKQQDHIARLETTIENLTSVVSSVERSIESMHQQMIERHFYLMFLEVLVFTGVILFCLNRKTIQSVGSTNEYQSIHSVEPVAISEVPQSNGSIIFRRKSADSKPTKDNSVGSNSAGNSDYNKSYSAVEEVKSRFTSAGKRPAASTVSVANDFSKKRKKKKLNHLRSLSSLDGNPKSSFLSLPSHSPATGLIFGTRKDNICEESLPSLRDKDLQFCVKRFSWDSSAYKPWKWNIFGSSQNNKSSSMSNSRLTVKPGRSEIQHGNISNGLTDHAKQHFFVNSCGIVDNRCEQKLDICLLDTNDIQLQNKCLIKKVTSRGRPVAE